MEAEPSPGNRERAASPHPTQVGPYRILETLGEGGMGTVYLAEQKEPVRRRVALKLIKLGMDSKAVLARFEAERRALSMMEHSCIATVLDAGVSALGQPYFVMEYVKGIPITDYCDQNKLGLQERIELLQKVCAGVQHAHLKGVMHRDLKPANVLVTLQDGKPTPKIIDFGLAKATDHHLIEATLFTQQGVVIGTPEYMSPEQAGLGGLDVDTRTDVYSLGVLLYELLVGELPFSRKDLHHAGMLEMQRVIREQEPTKPSTRITTLGDSANEHAAARRVEVAELQRKLRGDLDWIVLKALEKDRTRRYETAQELAADLERHLQFEPVLASPPSVGYRLQKLVRRYRGQVLAGGAVFLALVGGGIGTFLQYLRAEQKATEALALKAMAETNARLAEDRATENARLAQQKGELATAEALAKGEAQRAAELLGAKVREFDLLAGVVLYDRAIANERELHPPWPHKVDAMERWLRDDAGRLLSMEPGIRSAIDALRARALQLPPSAAEVEADRRAHPGFTEHELLRKQVTSLRHAQAIRNGTQMLALPQLTAEQQALAALTLNSLAWVRVAPTNARQVWGQEPLGLALAQAALAKARETDLEHQILDTTAWALLANGQDAAAKAHAATALAKAPGNQRAVYQRHRDDLETAAANMARTLTSTEARLAELATAVNQQRTYRFELESQRFLHDTLTDLLDKTGSLATKQRADVERRLRWARQVRDLTLHHPNCRHAWPAVRAAVASSARYRSAAIGLADEHVMGLVPVGMNPVTQLWEFYELRSAWDGHGDPRDIAIPQHRPDGSIEVTDDTGIVFVLLPGGTFTMGAQSGDPNGQNHDPLARPNETPHEVTLAPYFLARHELTRGQWHRLAATAPQYWVDGQQYDHDPVTIGPRHPIDSVSWDDANRCMAQHGLALPTEAQWEFGCRGGTGTPWWTGLEARSLHGAANVLDRTAARLHPEWGTAEPFDDGFTAVAPVGSYRPNGFGLHDVHGNVWEWCQDWYGDNGAPRREGDGLRFGGEASDSRVNRGGGYLFAATYARASYRLWNAPSVRFNALGVRAARALPR